MYIDRFNADSIRVAPCCQAIANIEPVDGFDFVTSKSLLKFRDQFNQGKKPAACRACWQAEANGHKSRRQSAIEFFDIKDNFDLVRLESIDHGATWACNMACVMCGPRNSSLWATELNYDSSQLTTIGRKFLNDNYVLNDIDVTYVKKIHFNGGEPMLNNHQLKLLDLLEKKDTLKNAFISYNTNGSIWPNHTILDYWRRTRLVKLFFSIDATGDAFEYIRWPGKWHQVANNIQRMRDQLPSNVMFGFNVTVGTYNILEILDVWHWFQQHIASNKEGDASDFNWQLALNFDPAGAPISAKQQAIAQMIAVPALSGIVNYLRNSLDSSENLNWLSVFNQYDQRRGTNWRQCLKISHYV